ncbi:OLC1v1025306C1 [Oldenlandia corymbosa var. corymbosa]|uniref:Cytochrome c-553 n=1 Tax=Oldenlandia corymbosa var. corymbosa TaxID=529605 RepID=A0AAV1C4H3_OLDCO|nr:OLC1v1025306C1 [Oldenlandia corymbosa var. corymbosa]
MNFYSVIDSKGNFMCSLFTGQLGDDKFDGWRRRGGWRRRREKSRGSGVKIKKGDEDNELSNETTDDGISFILFVKKLNRNYICGPNGFLYYKLFRNFLAFVAYCKIIQLNQNVSGGKKNYASHKPKEQRVNFFRTLAPPLMAAIISISPVLHPPVSLGQTIDIQKGTTLFHQACIGCHDAGGNIIQPGATLFLKDLERNGVATEEDIYRLTYFGKGRMPGFGENCTPRGQCTFGPRLQEDDIKLLAAFVKLQADQGWSNPETKGD